MKRVHTISLVNSCSLSPSFCSFSSSRSPTFHFLLFLSLLESPRPFSRRISSGSSFPAVNGQRGRKGEREQIRGETKLRVKPFPSLYRPLSLSLSFSFPSFSLFKFIFGSVFCSRHSNTEHESASSLFSRWRSIESSFLFCSTSASLFLSFSFEETVLPSLPLTVFHRVRDPHTLPRLRFEHVDILLFRPPIISLSSSPRGKMHSANPTILQCYVLYVPSGFQFLRIFIWPRGWKLYVDLRRFRILESCFRHSYGGMMFQDFNITFRI